MVKPLRQVAGVASVKVEDFKKGIFAVTPQRGAALSEQALREAVRRSGFTAEKVVPPKQLTETRPPPAGEEQTSKAMEKAVAEARQAFRQGNYDQVLRLARQAVVAGPRDPHVQQLLSLALFSQGKYPEAASAAHAALDRGRTETAEGAPLPQEKAAGPARHWDWKTLSRHYADHRDYTSQLRALEKHVREKPSIPQARFLLGYHYLMLGYTEAARRQLSQAAELDPKDELPARLLKQLDKADQTATPPEPKAPTTEK